MAWALLKRSCASGDALGCGALSELVLADDGLQRDAARAAALARSACDGGDGHGCARLAELCNDRLFYPNSSEECSRENVMRLRDRAVASLNSTCEGWAAYDCYSLATIYTSGDQANAIRFADGSCTAGDPGGCDLLGALTGGCVACATSAIGCDAGTPGVTGALVQPASTSRSWTAEASPPRPRAAARRCPGRGTRPPRQRLLESCGSAPFISPFRR